MGLGFGGLGRGWACDTVSSIIFMLLIAFATCISFLLFLLHLLIFYQYYIHYVFSCFCAAEALWTLMDYFQLYSHQRLPHLDLAYLLLTEF